MSKTIWKFVLDVTDSQFIRMPHESKILHVNTQRETVCMWAEVDPSLPQVLRRFCVYGTGHQMPDDPGRYIGSIMLQDGDLIFHIYEQP